MPYFPGVGYGVAELFSKVPGAIRAKKEYDEAQDLKLRQQKVNEDAEARALMSTESTVKESNYRMTKERSIAQGEGDSASINSGIGYSDTKEGAAPVEGEKAPITEAGATAALDALEGGTPAGDTTPDPYGLPKDEQGRYTMDTLGNPVTYDENTQEITSGNGHLLPTHGQSDVAKTGQKAGQTVRRDPLGKAGGAASKGPEVPTNNYGLGAKTELPVRKGEAVVTPTEGASMLKASEAEYKRAAEIKTRLEDALKTVDARYGANSDEAIFIKATLRKNVGAKYQEVIGGAEKAKRDGELANFAQLGTQVASSIISHVSQGGVVDQAFATKNAELFKAAGMDPGMLAGLRMSGTRKGDNPLFKGMMINAGGMIIPNEAVARLANPALPWMERVKGWEDVTKFLKIQDEILLKAREIASNDPVAKQRWLFGMRDQLVQRQAENQVRVNDLHKHVKEGTAFAPEVTMPDGSKIKVPLPVGNQDTSQDMMMKMLDAYATGTPAQRALYAQLIRPIQVAMWQNPDQIKFIEAMAGMKEMPSPEYLGRVAEQKAGGTIEGQLKALQEENARLKAANANPRK